MKNVVPNFRHRPHLLDLKKMARTSGCQRRQKGVRIESRKSDFQAPLKRSDAAVGRCFMI